MPSPIKKKTVAKRSGSGKKKQSIQTVALVSLGCPKNLVDSEKMLGLIAEAGLMPISDMAQADAIIINTCGFLEASKEESLGEIQQAAELKKAGRCQRLVVAGCLVQRHRAKMLEWCPEIDALIGVFDRDRIVAAVLGSREASDIPSENRLPLPVYSSIAASATIAKRERHLNASGYFESDAARLRLTPRHYAYLRISEGCNQNCAFCTIPSIRGKMRSKPLQAILAEASELIADGAFELNLIGQDTTSYGDDLASASGSLGLSEMLRALDKLVKQQGVISDGGAGEEGGVRGLGGAVLPSLGGGRVRLMYAYPSCFTDEMIDTIAELPSVMKYIDMPLQHINDGVLTSMRRRTSRKLIEKLLSKLRDRIAGIAIRTTFISGYPGETDAQHRELVNFVRDFQFEAMGVFPFSPEPGTPANRSYESGNAIDDEVVRQRVEELMLTQQELVFQRNARRVQEGELVNILIDSVANAAVSGMATGDESIPKSRVPLGKNARMYVGRSWRQAPQVDSVTYVASRQKLAPGESVPCRIVDFHEYDLIARPVSELSSKMSLPVLGQ